MLVTMMLFACSGPTEQQLVQAAREYLAQAKIYEAVIELKNALQENPENAEARYLLAGINLRLGDISSAEKEFRRAANAGWSEEQTQIGLARVMLARNALQALLDEIEVKDRYSTSARANLYALHALALAGLSNQDQAEKLLSEAVKLDATALYVLKSEILIRFATGDIASANKSLKQALARYGSEQEILLLSALVATGNKDQAGVAAAYRKVIALEPQNTVTFYGRKARLSLARLEISGGRFDQAQATLAPLLKQGANDPEADFVGGFLAFKQGKLDLAEKHLLMVLKAAPDYTQTQLLLGVISYAQNNYEQAAYYIARYISVVPGDLRARKLLGQTYSKLGQREKAQTALQPALKDHGDDAELLALVGLLQIQAGDTASGIKGLERAVEAAPESLALKNKLAKAYIYAGETENAVRALNAMLAKGGDKKHAQVLLVAAHIKAEQYARAINTVLGMIQDYPDDPAVLSLAGNVFEASKNRTEARKYFNRALQVSPGYFPATMLLAKLEELEGHEDKAELMYKKLAQVNKEDINALMALVRLAETQNRPEDMLNWLRQIGERSPQDIRSREMLVEYYLSKKLLRKAGLILKEAINLAPDDHSLLDLKARLHIANGQYNEALSPLSKLVAEVPDSAYVRTLLAEVHFKLDQQTDARRQLDIVLKKQPDYAPALALMASLALRSGHFDKAQDYAARLQKVRPDLYAGYELAGDALLGRKNNVAAKNSYDRAWQRKPLAGLAIKRSEASVRAGKFAEAARPLLAWLKDHPDDVRVLQSLGLVFQNMRQNGKAIKIYEKVLKIQPDSVVALNNLAWLYSLYNNPEALELAEKAYKAKPEDSGVQDTYGWILIQQSRVEEGLHILERVVKALPDVPEVQYHYAVALLKTGEEARAREILDRLLESKKPFEGRKDAEKLLK